MNGLAASQSASRRVRLFAWMLFVFWSLASLVSWGWGHAWPAEVQAEMGQAHAWSARPAIMHVMLWMVGAAGIWLGGNWMQRGNRQRDAAVRTLQENERKTRAVIDHAPDAILIHDKGGRIIEANPSVCAATGYTRQELLGMSLQGLDPGAALDSSQAGYWERLGEEQPPAVEITLRRKDGTRVPVEAILTTIEMAEGTCVLASMRSIAERKRAEAEREAFARLAMRLSACSSVKSIIKVVQEESRALLQWDAHYFAVRDQSEDRLVVLYYMDTVGGRLQEFPGEPWPTFPSDETWDLLGGKPCLLNRPTTAMEPSMVPFGDTARLSASLLDVPVCSGNRVIGILSVQSYTPNRYTVSDMYTLEQFARALAPALERAYAEQAFRDSEERFRTLAAATFEGIAITEHGRYIDVNEQFAGLLGYEVAELIGMSVEQVVAPEYREAGMQNGCEMLKEGQLLCKDGSRRTVESHGRTMTYHGREVRITAIRDITERNRAEAALRESESQFRTMFELAAVGMGQADPATGRLVRVNDRLCSMLGYTATELVGRRFSDFTHPEDRAHDWELFSRAARGETLEYRHQKRDVRKDGTIIWVDVNVGFIRDAAGHTLRTIAAILDITDRKRAEALLTTRVRLSELAQRTTLDELMQAAVDEAEISPIAGWGSCTLSRRTRSTSRCRPGPRAHSKARATPRARAGTTLSVRPASGWIVSMPAARSCTTITSDCRTKKACRRDTSP